MLIRLMRKWPKVTYAVMYITCNVICIFLLAICNVILFHGQFVSGLVGAAFIWTWGWIFLVEDITPKFTQWLDRHS